jgi:hypothetical protein
MIREETIFWAAEYIMLTRLRIELQKHSQIGTDWLSPISFGLSVGEQGE